MYGVCRIYYFSCNAFFLFRQSGKTHIYPSCLSALVATWTVANWVK